MVLAGRNVADRADSEHPNLSYRFWAAIILVMACSLALGLTLIASYYGDLDASRDNLSKLQAFRLALDAANRLTAERGPTNSVLGEEPSLDSPSRLRLIAFRVETDAALARISATAQLKPSMDALGQTLALARQQVDALASRPLSARGNAEIEQAVEAMFGVFDAAQPMLSMVMTGLLAGETDLVGHAMVARMLSELREYAGRLGSHLVIPMASGLQIDLDRRGAFELSRGRVLALWELAGQQTGASEDARVAAAHKVVVERFFGTGMALLERTLKAGQAGDFGLTPTSFTNLVVPTFAPLEQLRDVYLDVTVEHLQIERNVALRSLIAVVGATCLALLIELALLVASQNLLFRPLLRARSNILALADGAVQEPLDGRGMRGEMRSLFLALDMLRRRLIERNTQDNERAALTEKLRKRADTDGLTGVLNRGALERLVAHLHDGEADPTGIGLILLDIDYFKDVNDRFGHAAGDAILKEAAQRLRSALRRDDVIARFGGEEFAILLMDPQVESPVDVAERLRTILQASPFTLETGESVEVTASFGVARAQNQDGGWPALVAAADRALYVAKAAGRNRVEEDRETS